MNRDRSSRPVPASPAANEAPPQSTERKGSRGNCTGMPKNIKHTSSLTGAAAAGTLPEVLTSSERCAKL
eukprot:2072418-Rhodomonas_salina.1